MKVLITGGCGFVGTNLAMFLHSKGLKIDCLDNLSRKGSIYNLNLLKGKRIKNFKVDISNYNKIQISNKNKKYKINFINPNIILYKYFHFKIQNIIYHNIM
mgnify:CR=1 FL=1